MTHPQTTTKFTEFSELFRPIINQKMAEYIRFGTLDQRKILEDAMQYSVAAGGKRLRPLLVLATHQLFSDQMETVYPLACAIELLHTYSLIHDDLPSMDNDSLRRGMPTCHVKFGEDIAILAGDTLNTFSFELLSTQLADFFPAEAVLKVIREFSRACGIHGMSGGQVLDLRGVGLEADPEYLFQTHALKTGALISASISLPAVLGGVDTKELAILTRFGDQIGQLFQIVDDILDVVGNQEALGKSINKDHEQNKLTYIRVFGLDRSLEMMRNQAHNARQTLEELSLPKFSVLYSVVDYIETRTT